MKGFHLVLLVFLSIAGCGGGGGGATPNPTPNPISNVAPVIADISAPQILEGQQDVVTLTATDANNDSIAFSLAGGDDQELFAIDTNGRLSFKNPPDYEVPLDSNKDRKYAVTVQASDGKLSDSVNLSIEVLNAVEGRVVDAPLADAQVFIDCNDNGVKDNKELSVVTDEKGYYKLPEPQNCDNPILVSQGGRDTATGNEMHMTLMAKLPVSGETSFGYITPLASVLAFTKDDAQKVLILNHLGLPATVTVSDVAEIDPWDQSKSANPKAIRLQKLNNQLAVLINTAITLVGGAKNMTYSQKTAIVQSVADLAKVGKVDIADPGVIEQIFEDALADSDTQVSDTTKDSVSEAVATVSSYQGGTDPTSVKGIALADNTQKSLQNNVNKLIKEEMQESVFKDDNAQKWITILGAPIATPKAVATMEKAATPIELKGNNSDGNAATSFSIESLPDYGNLKEEGAAIESKDLPYRLVNNVVVYTGTSDFATKDSFAFKVISGVDGNQLQSAAATVSIRIQGINNKPVATDLVVTLLISS